MTKAEMKSLLRTHIDDVGSVATYKGDLDALLLRAAIHVQGIIEREDPNYFLKSATITLTNARVQSLASLGSIARIHSIEYVDGRDRLIAVYLQDLNTYTQPTPSHLRYTLSRIDGIESLQFADCGPEPGEVRILYTQNLAQVNDNQSFGIPDFAEELVVLRAAMQVAVSEKLVNVDDLRGLYNQSERDVKSRISPRVTSEGRMVRRTNWD
jgi:hypothetical protein